MPTTTRADRGPGVPLLLAAVLVVLGGLAVVTTSSPLGARGGDGQTVSAPPGEGQDPAPPVLATGASAGAADASPAWFLRHRHASGAADQHFPFGRVGDAPLVGDWNGDGVDTVGVRRGNLFFLRDDNSAGAADHDFAFGRAGDVALVGDWNGDGVDTVGVRRGSRFLLRDHHTAGPADLDYTFGRSTDVPVTGDVTGDGTTTVGVWRGALPEPDPEPTFQGSARALPDDVRQRMTGSSWRTGCPVHLDDLRLLRVSHHGMEGTVRQGEMVVHRRVAGDLLRVFEDLFEAGFPIERMRLIDEYGADDDASMADNNSSAFNCRTVTSGSRWSEHAYGTAVDLNPIQNPYVRDGTVLPPEGRAYRDRSDVRPGMIVRPGPVVAAFDRIGWGWGGDWSSLKDYMHFSESGR